jgi:hypothetical protein
MTRTETAPNQFHDDDFSEDEIVGRLKTNFGGVCEYVKLVVATGVVLTLVLVAMIGIANRWCILQIHPAALYVLLLCAVTILAYLEALHYACKLSK